ncbi:restriction endonuclease subunit S [Chryseobacterium sp. YIM B08800]|uniref:restriction endonuclease subunit S n=1 Tax=Chryseobacterium sp. YIM B08800 TaxID=2984136 RepID=UPI002240D902|nr:restriction endonuclease subunit S [Chryseobacterium sp. YIM B08800]
MKELLEKHNLPESWELVKLNDIAYINMGQSPPSNTYNYNKEGLPFFQGKAEFGKLYPTVVKYCSQPIKVAKKNDILISVRAPIGATNIATEDCCIGRGLASINTFGKIPHLYVLWYLRLIENEIIEFGTGSVFKAISKITLENINIPISSVSETERIVFKIEELFSKLDEAEKGLEKASKGLKIYRQTLLNQAFFGKLTERWRRENSINVSSKQLIDDIKKERQTKYDLEVLEWEKSLKKWKEEKKGKRPSKPSKPIVPDKPTEDQMLKTWKLPKEWQWTQLGLIAFITKLAGFEYTEYVKYTEKGDLPVIKAENIGQDGFKKTVYSKVIAESIEPLKRSKLVGGELIIVFVGSLGNVGTIPKNQSFFLGPNIAMARPYNEINTKFLEYFYQSHRGKKLLLATSKAVAQPSLSMGNIRQTPIALPCKEEQFQIVQIIENQFTLISNLEKNVDNVLNEIIALKHSILKKAFEGRLVNYTSNESIESLLNDIQIEKKLYLENLKELNRSKPKQKKKMEEKKPILEILKESNSPISAKELWEKSTSEGDIERFYNEIKEIYHQIDEVKSKTESLLTLKDEDK